MCHVECGDVIHRRAIPPYCYYTSVPHRYARPIGCNSVNINALTKRVTDNTTQSVYSDASQGEL